MKKLFLLLASTALILISNFTASAQIGSGRIIDLSHAFDSETVYWPTADSFRLEKDFEGTTDKGYFYSANKFSTAEHGGTHIDAPVHFAKGKHSVDEIP
jgi:kynurenine formamidase